MKKQRVLVLTLAGLLGLSACVDNKYDLENLNTDSFEIGETITAPLGKGTIEADKLLDTKNVKEIKIDADGNYLVVYSNSLEVNMPDDMDLKTNSVTLFTVFDAPTELSGTTSLPGLSASENIGFTNQPDKIRTIDSILFDRSKLDIQISLTNYTIKSGSADLIFGIDFPEGFVLEAVSPAYYTLSADKHSIRVQIPFTQLKQPYVQLPVKVKKAVPGEIKAKDFQIAVSEGNVEFNKPSSPSLGIKVQFDNLDYQMVYGKFDIDFTDISSRIAMDDFNAIFEGNNNVLSFADPHIKLTTESNVGLPLTCALSLEGSNDTHQSQKTEISGITIAAATLNQPVAYSKWWIGGMDSRNQYPNDGQSGGEYSFKKNEDISKILKIMPKKLDMNLNVNSATGDAAQFFVRDAYAKVNYEVEIPFAPAKDFMANVTETINDAFDEDLIDYAFANGSATISGNINNSFPLNFVMNLIITDAAGNSVGIDFSPQDVKGSSDGKGVNSKVTFTITEKDMDKMSRAKNIKVWLAVLCDEQLAGKCIKKGQQLELNLGLSKSGGIVIEN